MSYRTYINGVQLFGNNESYPEWDNMLVKQGIEISSDGKYDGELTDFMAMLEALEQIVMRLELDYRVTTTNLSLFDNRWIYDDTKTELLNDNEYGLSLFDRLMDFRDNSYIFLPVVAYESCKNQLVPSKRWGTEKHLRCYELKQGETIHVEAY